MRILGVIVAHDKKISILHKVLECSRRIKELDSLEIFCFNTEKETIKFANDNNLPVRVFKRPEIDRKKIKTSYVMKMSGLWEGELMHLSWLRNKTIESADERNFDCLFTIDADILFAPNTVERLLELNADVSCGWYFNKRAPFPSISSVGIESNIKKMEEKIKNREIIDVATGGMGGVLIKKSVYHLKFDLYNGKLAEDTRYYMKVRKSGFTIKCNTDIYYKHIGDGFIKISKEHIKEKEAEWNLCWK